METRRYEMLVLADPDITAGLLSEIEGKIGGNLGKHGGSVETFDIWGKYKLAYPIRKRWYGTYFLVRFRIQKEGAKPFLDELDRMFKIKYPDEIWRFFVRRIDNDAPDHYKYPAPVTTGGSDVSALIAKKVAQSEQAGEPDAGSSEEVRESEEAAASSDESAAGGSEE